MPRFPPPCDETFVIIDGSAIPVQSLAPEKWVACKKKMMENVGRAISEELAREAMMQKEAN